MAWGWTNNPIVNGAKKVWDYSLPGAVTNASIAAARGDGKKAAEDLTKASPPGFIYNEAVKPGLAYAKDKIKDGYDWAYGEPAEQQKQAYDKAGSDIRSLGYNIAGQYDARGAGALGRYDRATSILDSYQPRPAATSAGNYNLATAATVRPGVGGSPLQRSAGYNTTYQPTYSQDLYNRTVSAPTTGNAQDFYSNFRPTTSAADYLRQRQASGYGPNYSVDRYSTRVGSASAPMNLERELGTFRDFATGGTSAARRSSDLRGEFAGPDILDNRINARTLNTDQAGVGANYFSGRLDRGDTAGGRVMADLASGNTQGGKFVDYLKGNESASNRFLGGFDPNSTRALDETYSRLRDEGPTYEEDFYTSTVAGNNPAYNFLKEELGRDLRNSAATRGGFVSGKALENEERGFARLAAEEFAKRGDLAARAGDSRRARLGQQLSGAEALDAQLLGQRGLYAETALGREGMMGEAAGQADALRADLAGNQDSIGADLAKFGDTERRLYEEGIDALTGKAVDRNLARSDQLNNLAVSDDSARTARMSDYATTVGTADTNRMQSERDLDALARGATDTSFAREQQLDTLADRASVEERANADRRLTAGTAADSDARARDTNLAGLARDSSAEVRNNFKDRFDAAMRVGDSQAAIQQVYDLAALGAITQAELSAIDMQLAKAGVDATTRQNLVNNVMQIAGLGVKAYGASQGVGA
jgi:hypothetical protein